MKKSNKKRFSSLSKIEKDIIANGGHVHGVSEKEAEKYRKKMKKEAERLIKATQIKARNDFSPFL